VFSILHISDLHRSIDDPISNDELMSALVGDRSRYVREDPAIRSPDAIVISGDIIQGVPLGTQDAPAKIASQYAAAEAFIVELTNRFLDGDRSKVVLIPGNHDIDWVTARSAMNLVGVEDQPKGNLASELFREDTPYRWSWKTRELYRIGDQATYARRLEAFWTFFERFYENVPGLLKVRPRSPANLYSLQNGRIGLSAFDSCHGNDCFAFHGSIPREVVARAHLDLVEEGNNFELLIAVWHHNVEGPPYRNDYMDIDIVRGMIGRGFRIGLFGHQHRPEAVPHQIHLAARETMAVIGAGSLCAGARELPLGAHRGYNIIEVTDDMKGARVHVREAGAVANLFGPSRRPAFGGKSYTDLSWDPPADLMGRPIDQTDVALRSAVQGAERLLNDGLSHKAVSELLPYRNRLPEFGRRLLIEAVRASGDYPLLIDILTPPGTITELVDLVEVCVANRRFEPARTFLLEHGARLAVSEPTAAELRSRIDASEAIAR